MMGCRDPRTVPASPSQVVQASLGLLPGRDQVSARVDSSCLVNPGSTDGPRKAAAGRAKQRDHQSKGEGPRHIHQVQTLVL